MKGAIPVLPIILAWFCLVFNVIVPGAGNVDINIYIYIIRYLYRKVYFTIVHGIA